MQPTDDAAVDIDAVLLRDIATLEEMMKSRLDLHQEPKVPTVTLMAFLKSC